MTNRGPFDGVRDVVQFNWPTYVAATGVACVLAATRSPAAKLVSAGLFTGIAGSLAAVHLAYDRSGLYELDWLPQLSQSPRTLVLHAGLDDVSVVLQQRHSIESVVPVDIFEQDAHTESSILRARNVRPATDAESADNRGLSSTGEFDLAIGFLSVHELRASAKRIAMFEQVKTALTTDGRLVIVEHMRDAANSLAFGWGAMHFFPRSTWISDLKRAGFDIETEQLISPFVRAITTTVRPD